MMGCGLSSAEHHTFVKSSGVSGWKAILLGQPELQVTFFKGKEDRLVVLDEGDNTPRYGSLSRALKASECRAGCNGGYFAADSKRTPLGLVITSQGLTGQLAKGAFTVAGIIYDTGKEIRLERSNRLTFPVSKMKAAVQGGPFLVDGGEIVSGLNGTKKARRTFIATDGKSNWALGISSPLTLRELAEWLLTPGSLGKFKVHKALNMDGGTSSAYINSKAGVRVTNLKSVRNYIGIRSR